MELLHKLMIDGIDGIDASYAFGSASLENRLLFRCRKVCNDTSIAQDPLSMLPLRCGVVGGLTDVV
jgi:hypothetical protein